MHGLLALVALAAPSALALSAHSPRDLEALPAYSIVLHEQHPVLNSTVQDLLREPLETPPNSLPPKRHLLRTPSGQAFLCTVPPVTDESRVRAAAQAEEDALARNEERQRGLERGLALLEPMRGGCLYQKQNWFTYSFCYGSEIRQFHEIRTAGSVGPTEDPNSDTYVLGQAPEPSVFSSSPKYGSGSAALAKKEAMIPSRLGGGERMGWDEGGRYLSQVWEGGTICDKTGLPRTVEVQFHCNTQTIDRIALIRETSICRYVMLIHTPRLCAEPLFLEGVNKNEQPASSIECRPVVTKLSGQGAGREGLEGEGEGGRRTLDEGNAALHPPEQFLNPQQHASSSSSSSDAARPSSPDAQDPHQPQHHLVSSTDDQTQEHEPEHDHDVDATVTLVYDPETGQIESAVTEVGEEVFAESDLRRLLYGDEGEEGAGAAAPGGAEQGGGGARREARDEPVTMQGLEDMVKLMRETLANALRDHANPAAAAAPPRDAAAPPPPLHHPARPAAAAAENEENLRLDQLLSFIHQFSASPSFSQSTSSSDDDQGDHEHRKKIELQYPELHQYLEQFEKEKKKTVRAPREVSAAVAVPGSEAHEKLKKGFERRYDEEWDSEGEWEGEKRDEDHDGGQQTRASAAPPPRDEL
ncbi:hypothetical protein JCM1841_006575 [Sporobolomyces salmonicolor]